MKIKDHKKNLSTKLKASKLPDKPGVYFFMKGKTILYIGKATSLKDRTKSYLSKDPEGKFPTFYGASLIATRGPLIVKMVKEADGIKWQETDSVLEALILESALIKKHQPKYNLKEKDDKSWNYVCITDDDLPKVVIIRGRNIQSTSWRRCKFFGPYTNGIQLKEALKIIRKIFPFLDDKSKNNYEFYRQLKLVPENTDYDKNIKNIKLFFEGKKKKIIQNLKKEMLACAKRKEFEKAGKIKKQIFALQHINDVALIKNETLNPSNFSVLRPSRSIGRDPRTFEIERVSVSRIEAYDIAHMSGENMVGVMTVIENGEIVKSEYKKFIIKTQLGAPARQSRGGNDTGALEEVLSRRLRHTEWGIPSLIVVDGNTAQINVAHRVLARYQFKIPVVGVVKDDRHKAKAIMGDENIIKKYKSLILLANNEAHRFAINFYRAKSRKNMLK